MTSPQKITPKTQISEYVAWAYYVVKFHPAKFHSSQNPYYFVINALFMKLWFCGFIFMDYVSFLCLFFWLPLIPTIASVVKPRHPDNRIGKRLVSFVSPPIKLKKKTKSAPNNPQKKYWNGSMDAINQAHADPPAAKGEYA